MMQIRRIVFRLAWPSAFIWLALFGFAARADVVSVAVAGNFLAPIKLLAQEFERSSGHQLRVSAGSTGKLYAQIVNGAPFDVFLAANAAEPTRLEQAGVAVAGTRFTYARGRVVLWSADAQRIRDNGPALLASGGFRRIAIANPRTAPYGAAALPLVLPPTVLGFYLLVSMGPQGMLGSFWVRLTGQPLSFSFTGVLLASCLYSLPFVVQPLQAAFESMDRRALEAAWTLGASHTRAFLTVVVPQIRRGLLIAVVLGFAHTLGEFGVVLMVGGNIPGETQVVSIAIYEQVEALDYRMAQTLSLGLLVFSFLVLFVVYNVNRRWHVGLRT